MATKKVEEVVEAVEAEAKKVAKKAAPKAEQAEKVLEEAAEKVEAAVEETAEKAKKAAAKVAEKAAEKVEEAAREAGAKAEKVAKAAGDAAKKAKKAADQGGKKAKGAAKEAKKLTGTPRLKQRYRDEVVPALTAQFHYANPMEIPRLEKIIINMGLGAEKENPKGVEAAAKELGLIAGQKPVVTKAKKSVANFKVREGMNVGAMVTLRGDRMYYFVDKFVNIVLPRVRDFRGVSNKSFDGRGNYAMGVREQLIFPEINFDDVDRVRGMNIVFVTSARTDEEAKALLTLLGMPFAQD